MDSIELSNDPSEVTPDFTGSLPIAHSVLSGKAIIKVVSRCYALPTIQRCYLLRRGFNEVYRLDLENGTTLVARLSALRHRGPANTDFEVSMLEHLDRQGAAVGVPVRPISGKASVGVKLPEGIRQLALFTFLPGEQPDSSEDASITGAGLAAIHAAAEGFKGPASRHEIGSRYLVEQPLAQLLQSRSMDDQLREQLQQRCSALAQSLNDCEPALTRSFCHGDCHGGNNMIWTDDSGKRRTAFFDFDDAAPGFKAYDVAVYLWGELLGEWPIPDVATIDDWQSFLSGYLSVGHLSDADRAAIPMFVCARHIWFLGEFASRSTQWGSEALPNRRLHKQIKSLDGWLAMSGFDV